MTPERLSALMIFASVVENRSFSKAARLLGRSKSAVSKQVAALEDQLGARLINRTTRRLSLTEAGQTFYEGCRRALAEIEAAEESVTRLASSPRGRLRVSAPMSFGQEHLAPAISSFLRRYPEIRIDIHLSDSLVDLVAEGFDVGVRIGSLPDSSLVARRLSPLRRVVCAAPGYLARRGRPERPEDLIGHDCLLYSYFSSGRDWRFRESAGERRVRVDGPLEANNGDLLRSAALAGLGVAFLPSFIVGEDLRAGRLAVSWRAGPTLRPQPSTLSIPPRGTSPPRCAPSWISWRAASGQNPIGTVIRAERELRRLMRG